MIYISNHSIEKSIGFLGLLRSKSRKFLDRARLSTFDEMKLGDLLLWENYL